MLACPLTFNSVNNFAHGHADNFAVGLLCEMAGYGVPMVVVPHCKPQLARHPAFAASIETLRGMGVQVLFAPDAPEGPQAAALALQVVAALPAIAAGAALKNPYRTGIICCCAGTACPQRLTHLTRILLPIHEHGPQQYLASQRVRSKTLRAFLLRIAHRCA